MIAVVGELFSTVIVGIRSIVVVVLLSLALSSSATDVTPSGAIAVDVAILTMSIPKSTSVCVTV